MVVKMDNTPSSAPQRGLGAADLVVEELVEGGVTRLAAFYYSDIPGTVGPVRSMRASDIGIVSPADAAVVTSGAAPVTLQRVRGAGIDFFSEGAKGFFRDSGRAAPYNLFTDLAATTTLVECAEARPDDYLPWGDAQDLPKGKPARSLSAELRQPHHHLVATARRGGPTPTPSPPQDERFPADTVLVLRVQVGDAGYRDPAGNPVPETKLEGKGEALLFHDGRVVRGQWSKTTPARRRSRCSVRGKELTVPAGRTWIELVPGRDRLRRDRLSARRLSPRLLGQLDPGVDQRLEAADDEADRGLDPGGGGDRRRRSRPRPRRPRTSRRRRSGRRSAACPRRGPRGRR